MEKSKVAVVACPDYKPAHVKESLQKGLEAIGGLESLIGKEENILLKPNLVRSAKRERAVVTDPEVMDALITILQENGYENIIYRDHSNRICEENYKNILSYVKRPDVAAVCSVSSRASIMLARALQESGKAGKLVAVGSDLFEENKQALRSGVFQNLIQKNPFAQAFMATRMLVDYLLKDVKPEESFVVGSQVVFRSNLCLFEKNLVRFLE